MTNDQTINPDERAFAAEMLAYFRRAGRDAAWVLLDRMNDEAEDGCYRADFRRMVREAMAVLPTLQ